MRVGGGCGGKGVGLSCRTSEKYEKSEKVSLVSNREAVRDKIV